MQTPLTRGQEWSGYSATLGDCADRMEDALKGVYQLALGSTAVGTGINAVPGFDTAAASEIAKLTRLPDRFGREAIIPSIEPQNSSWSDSISPSTMNH